MADSSKNPKAKPAPSSFRKNPFPVLRKFGGQGTGKGFGVKFNPSSFKTQHKG